MNGDSGETPKAFTINQNGGSRSSRIGVHDGSESVFMMGQNMQTLLITAIGLIFTLAYDNLFGGLFKLRNKLNEKFV